MVEDYFEQFHMMDRTSHNDDLAGVGYTWSQGVAFKAGCVMNSSNEAQIAYQAGAKTIYTIIIPLTVSLSINDRIKRDKSGMILRITSNPEDMTPPVVASPMIKYKQCTAEVVQN